jgi:hypothetical protein
MELSGQYKPTAPIEKTEYQDGPENLSTEADFIISMRRQLDYLKIITPEVKKSNKDPQRFLIRYLLENGQY